MNEKNAQGSEETTSMNRNENLPSRRDFLLQSSRTAAGIGIAAILGNLGTWALSLGADSGWRRAFLGGMLAAGAGMSLLYPPGFVVDISRSLVATVVGGVLIGAGTQLGSGCTSGHGICGIGRLSGRSLVATCVFMAAGAIAVLALQRVFHGAL